MSELYASKHVTKKKVEIPIIEHRAMTFRVADAIHRYS